MIEVVEKVLKIVEDAQLAQLRQYFAGLAQDAGAEKEHAKVRMLLRHQLKLVASSTYSPELEASGQPSELHRRVIEALRSLG